LGGCQFDAAAFTNLTQDHLDYHKTMEAYLNTKLRLFQWLTPEKYAVVNIDDPAGQSFIKATKAHVLTYGLNNKADISAQDIKYSIQGTQYRLVTPQGEISVNTKLVGKFNVYNALAAVGFAVSQGIPLEQIKSGLESKITVAGRFESIDKGQDFSVVVDYAHTPDGLENVLKLARQLKPNRLVTLFGCGGDRDKEKRPIMGSIADTYSDMIIITADNPRNEDPAQISKEIASGIQKKPVEIVLDRYQAIKKAISAARKGDIIMLCGKGHETTQTVGMNTFHFNDREAAEEILSQLA
jgi:UDP-N-acetylmuramoyl-L-alanyl-D-glutamate--2,6-diaminopimelate ligase